VSATLPELSDVRGRAWVYVLDCDMAVRIGVTADLERRLKLYHYGAGQPFTLFRHFLVESREQAVLVEAWVHHNLSEHRLFGEWFNVHPIEAVDEVLRVLREAPGERPAEPERDWARTWRANLETRRAA
jgi:predicted GIY-YIG superfamily endonuclease